MLRVDRLNFAVGTPYETRFAPRPARAAGAAGRGGRGAAHGAVGGGRGAARRGAAGAFKLADGTPLALGGKTGTGDNRIVIGRGGARGVALNRTATFVFYPGRTTSARSPPT